MAGSSAIGGIFPGSESQGPTVTHQSVSCLLSAVDWGGHPK